MPGGAALYQYLIESQTTTNMTPTEVHNLGLSEVKRITAEMEKVKQQVGFKDTLAEFFVAVRTDPKFHPATAQAFGDDFRSHRQARRCGHPQAILDDTQIAARNPSGAGLSREKPSGGLL